jgi:predicted CXXCH cytochrome family protein
MRMRVFLMAGVVGAMLAPALAFGQIVNSKHDLSYTGNAVYGSGTETEICKYCHTPHRALSTRLLWNHRNTAVTNYSWGNDLDGNPLTLTTQGTSLPTNVSSGSRRCLSCHDGTVAIGDVYNAGNGVAGIIPVAGADQTGGFLSNPAYMMTATNMTGNHPVSIAYAGQIGYNGTDSKAFADGAIGNYFAVVAAGCTSASGYCTAAPATGGRNGAAVNLIPDASGRLGVECGSCHEPHNRYGFPRLTRISMVNSGLCRSCHNK